MNIQEKPEDAIFIYKTRKALRLSVQNFALWLGMSGKNSERNIRRWEKGTHKIPKWVIDKILFPPIEIK